MVKELPISNRQIEEVRFTESSNVVVALFGNERSPEVLTEMGLALADGTQLEVVHLTEVPEAYSLVPYDTSRTIADAVQAHVAAMSAAAA